MPRPRYTQIDIHATPNYHCISRCVRRAFLCGADRLSGRCFDHRKAWLVEQLAELTDIFAVDLCPYSVLSNHYHLVVHLASERAWAWSDDAVVARYGRLFAATVEAGMAAGRAQAAACIARWRARLYDLSWFMRCLNEAIARRANAEDDCTGRFWEGRFRSQALLDAAGLVTCMAYVDLNPLRAGLATSLCDCNFTSIQQRLQTLPPGDHAEAIPEPASEPSTTRQPTLQAFGALTGTRGAAAATRSPRLCRVTDGDRCSVAERGADRAVAGCEPAATGGAWNTERAVVRVHPPLPASVLCDGRHGAFD